MGDKMIIVLFRAVILYALIIFSIRLMGKRQLGELQPSELVITILVSNIATLPIEDVNVPMAMGIIPILSLVSLDVIMSTLTLHNKKLRKIVSGSPKIIISDGVIDQVQLKCLRYSVDDVMESLRAYSIFDIGQIQYAIVETTGKISILQKSKFQTCTAKMMDIEFPSENPPQIVIDDGVLIEKSLEKIKLNEFWLNRLLDENAVMLTEVFLLTADSSGEFNLIKKDAKK